ncbi:STAS domain-containing protein [Catellatospora tritici]|uniref:STAS domain-containing protein n=1 Tax=Catellatospora tritici TaxID=2851566 RepID=UPI001C2D0B0A|nr:STAS domain-containing protein [Catellatospora tritici]MBV1856516.1 STAS domain-containing protein [Catellatospora tritici]
MHLTMDNAGRRPQASHKVELAPDIVRVSLVGEIDMGVEDAVEGWLTDAIRTHPDRRLEVDVSRVTFLDSSGIRVLLHAHAQAVQEGCAFRLTGAHGTVRDVLEIVDVYDLLTGGA